ncbi:MAG: hypothetical protein KDK33_00960 [Leptospiraceae bacterium]|nr:hypothetical protein [Leptospiraceae bacterium]
MNREFEIHAPRISEQELETIIRRRLEQRNLDPEEVRKVESLNFAPLSSFATRGFDPAETADLFERSATVPGFRSGKFRWLKGPLGWVARRVYLMSSLLMDKLSEHKVEAFYNVIGELIFLRRQVAQLQNRLSGDPLLGSGGSGAIRNVREPDPADPLLIQCQARIKWLGDMSVQGPISVVDDAGGYMEAAARREGLEVDSIGSMDLVFQDAYYLRPGSIVIIPAFLNLRTSPSYVISSLSRFAGSNSYLMLSLDFADSQFVQSIVELCKSRGYKLLERREAGHSLDLLMQL